MNNASVETRQQRRHSARQQRKGAPKPQKNAFYRAMAVAKNCADALRAAASLGQIAMKIAMMDLAIKLGQYKSRGHGRGTPMCNSRPYCNNGGKQRPHQSGQECLRRAVGGWGFRKNYTGMTKAETMRLLAAGGDIRIPLERAVAIVRGLDYRMAA